MCCRRKLKEQKTKEKWDQKLKTFAFELLIFLCVWVRTIPNIYFYSIQSHIQSNIQTTIHCKKYNKILLLLFFLWHFRMARIWWKSMECGTCEQWTLNSNRGSPHTHTYTVFHISNQPKSKIYMRIVDSILSHATCIHKGSTKTHISNFSIWRCRHTIILLLGYERQIYVLCCFRHGTLKNTQESRSFSSFVNLAVRENGLNLYRKVILAVNSFDLRNERAVSE